LKRNSILFFISLGLTLLFAELFLRIFYPVPQIMSTDHVLENKKGVLSNPAYKPVHLSIKSHPDQQGILFYETITGLRLRPNTDILIKDHFLSHLRVSLRTNALGYRGPEVLQKSPQKTRILFLGDSITLADYLPEEETFVRLIESRALTQGLSWETINAGVGAIGLKTELRILHETGLLIQPDVVVLNFYLNDFEESMVFFPPQSSWMKKSFLLSYILMLIREFSCYFKDNGVLEERNLRFLVWKKNLESRWHSASGVYHSERSALQNLILSSFNDWGGAWSEEAWESMQPYFAELKALSERFHFKLVCVVHPVRYQVDASYVEDWPQQKIKKILSGYCIPVFDLLPILREAYSRGKPLLFHDQCHHTTEGSRVVSEAVFDFLSQEIRTGNNHNVK
jgi:hypothetical protein